jgi:hypothetical protein
MMDIPPRARDQHCIVQDEMCHQGMRCNRASSSRHISGSTPLKTRTLVLFLSSAASTSRSVQTHTRWFHKW